MRPLLRVVLLAHLLAESLVGAGAAQVRPVGLATRPGNVHFSQSAALLPDGRFAAVWTQGRTAFLQYVDSNGTVAFGAPGRAVATVPVAGAEAVVVAHARDGVLVAVRRRIDQDNSRILVQWLDGHGDPRWGAGTYAAPVAGREDQLDPFLLASSDGGGFVCFVRAAQDVARNTFYCQRFSPEGQRLWGTGGARGSSLSPLYAEEPKAVAAGDGGLLVFWRAWAVSDDPKVFLRGQRLGPDGGRRWGDDGTIVFKNSFPCDNGCAITPPWISAVSDGAGGAILAFDDRIGRLPEDTDFNHVTAQRMSAAGERMWGEGVSVLPSRPPQNLYELFAHPDGGAVVAVVTFPFALVDGGIHLVLQRLAADGRPLWPMEGVTVVDLTSSPDNVYEGPVFGSVDGGVLRIAWERSNTGFLHRRSEIRFSAFDAAGNRLTPSDGVPLMGPVASGDDSLIRGFAFDPASGTSFVVWDGARGAAAVLYAPR
ncbi:MAG TPA: hypothetical protein VF173_00530 [Thermoanaerobaculia bacterium]|nr:hypothetical protein [Thermoanaerobaculia bacterium]